LIVLCENNVFFLASKKKIEFIRQVDSSKESGDNGLPAFSLLVRDKVLISYSRSLFIF